VLRTGKLDEAGVGRALDVIERNVKVQAQLVEDLLDVSRIVSGKLRMEQRPLELRAVVEAGLEAVRPTAAAKRVKIAFRPGLDPLRVLGDPERLQQVVWNLVANAIKFTPEEGRVEVVLDLGAAGVRLQVSDNGIGISPEFLPHVFDRFRQGTTGSSRTHGGLGLGLTIVRHLVEAHGGTVRAESDGVGKGARFLVTLPMLPEVRALPAGGTASPGPSEALLPRLLEGVRVLVVDDDPEVGEVVGLLLGQAGAQVRTAQSVAAALDAIDFDLPDVLLSDIGMPGTDGYALARRLRERPPDRGGMLPAVALTAYASPEHEARARAAGFDLHLAKPIDPARVIQALASLTGRA
jgi:CheY-like chemotaxis protein